MMREIKFRQRNKNNGQFHYWGMVDGEWRQPLLHENYVHPKDSDQFTGLPDKNKKEIYEGDIVKFRMDFQGNEYNNFEDSFCTDYTGEVVITASKGVCLKNPIVVHVDEIDGEPSKLGYYRQISGCRSEVIGNIYEKDGK